MTLTSTSESSFLNDGGMELVGYPRFNGEMGRMLAHLCDLDKLVAWYWGARLYELNVGHNGQGWTTRVKAHRGSELLVGFQKTPHYITGLLNLADWVGHRKLRWFPDKYPGKIGKLLALNSIRQGGKSLR